MLALACWEQYSGFLLPLPTTNAVGWLLGAVTVAVLIRHRWIDLQTLPTESSTWGIARNWTVSPHPVPVAPRFSSVCTAALCSHPPLVRLAAQARQTPSTQPPAQSNHRRPTILCRRLRGRDVFCCGWLPRPQNAACSFILWPARQSSA